ncbi:MAG: C_GCAxxG_C_C family protein [bacterium]|nr:MAG: C_GCAxxG_C_C family protein [bacterium]
MNRIERAVKSFEEDFNCAQSVFSAFAPDLGLERETALRIATGFGGGMARMGSICGAVTGAFMAIGLRHGRTEAGDTEAKERTYALIREFATRFTERHGSIICRELIDCDISTPEGLRDAEDSGVFTEVCPNFVKDAATILDELLSLG